SSDFREQSVRQLQAADQYSPGALIEGEPADGLLDDGQLRALPSLIVERSGSYGQLSATTLIDCTVRRGVSTASSCPRLAERAGGAHSVFPTISTCSPRYFRRFPPSSRFHLA